MKRDKNVAFLGVSAEIERHRVEPGEPAWIRGINSDSTASPAALMLYHRQSPLLLWPVSAQGAVRA